MDFLRGFGVGKEWVGSAGQEGEGKCLAELARVGTWFAFRDRLLYYNLTGLPIPSLRVIRGRFIFRVTLPNKE